MKTLSIVLASAALALTLAPRAASADDDTVVHVVTNERHASHDVHADVATRSSFHAGLALAIAGGVLAVGGIATFAGALAMRPSDQSAVDVQLGLLLGGPTAAGVGIGLLVPAVILLATRSSSLGDPRKAGVHLTVSGASIVF